MAVYRHAVITYSRIIVMTIYSDIALPRVLYCSNIWIILYGHFFQELDTRKYFSVYRLTVFIGDAAAYVKPNAWEATKLGFCQNN